MVEAVARNGPGGVTSACCALFLSCCASGVPLYGERKGEAAVAMSGLDMTNTTLNHLGAVVTQKYFSYEVGKKSSESGGELLIFLKATGLSYITFHSITNLLAYVGSSSYLSSMGEICEEEMQYILLLSLFVFFLIEITYKSECYSNLLCIEAEKRKAELEAAENKMSSFILSVTRMDSIRNEDIKGPGA